MKINKWLFYISMIINILLLIVSTILYFNYKSNDVISYIVSILLNIFAGSFILSITSLVNYFIYRRYLLRDIMNECLNYSHVFSKLEYFVPKKYDENNFKNIKMKDKSKFIEQYQHDLQDDNDKKLRSILKEYISISDISTRELWNIYDDLDFIIDVTGKKKKDYWNKIFSYIYSNICIIKEYSYHFKKYISANNGNYKINEDKLCELQDKIFFHKIYTYEKENDVKKVISDIDVGYCIIEDGKSSEFTLVYNKLSDYLLKMFDSVGKDNYFSKNYSGIGSDK